MSKSIVDAGSGLAGVEQPLSSGEREVLERLRQCGGMVTTAAPGPTHLVRRLWQDSSVPARDERVGWCAALIRNKQIKWHPSATESTATYRCAPAEDAS